MFVTILQRVRKVWNQWEFYLLFIIYITPTLYAFSQPLYHACADFAQHIGIDSSTTVCNSLPKVTEISDFTAYTCVFRNPQNAKSPPIYPMLMPLLAFKPLTLNCK
jgi:hypothetical protein